jgi:hypothetical protein
VAGRGRGLSAECGGNRNISRDCRCPGLISIPVPPEFGRVLISGRLGTITVTVSLAFIPEFQDSYPAGNQFS